MRYAVVLERLGRIMVQGTKKVYIKMRSLKNLPIETLHFERKSLLRYIPLKVAE